jgi:hypothetical protein
MPENQNPVHTDATLSGDGTEARPLRAVGGGGTPGGPNQAIQFNDGGVFGGEVGAFPLPGMAWDKTTGEITIVGAPGGLQSFLGAAGANAGFQVDDTGASPVVLVVNDVNGGEVLVASDGVGGFIKINADSGIDLETTNQNITVTADAGLISIEAHDDVIIISDTTSTKIRSGGGTMIEVANPNKIGFFTATPIAQPTVTGSRGGNAALASLLTQLAALGLIVDGTSA